MTTPTTEVTATPQSILDTVGDEYGISGRDLYNALAETIFPNKGKATQAQVQALMVVASKYDLNPFTKEIYAFPAKGGGVVPIVSVDGWYKMANAHPQMDGVQAEAVMDGGKLIAYTSTIWRKDREHPTIVTETLEENKRGSEPWRNQPHRMLRHRAITQNIRITFGFAGIYDPDEGERIVEGPREAESEVVQDVNATIDIPKGEPADLAALDRAAAPEPEPEPAEIEDSHSSLYGDE